MSAEGVWKSEDIRRLRGQASRSEFAARLGVSPLTVYRWELPDDAREARRPRGKIKQRLDALARGELEPAAARRVQDELTVAELAELGPLLEALARGEFARVEDALLAALASGRLRTHASRALATQALARVQLWARADVRGAFTTLLPVLDDAEQGVLPAPVACEVHVTAALVFSGLDGRFFDAGKTSVHVARAERLLAASAPAHARFLLWYAQVAAAFVLGDAALLQFVLARSGDVDQDLTSPLLLAYAAEVRAIAAYLNGRAAEAGRHFQEILRRAAAGRFAQVEVRALAQAARQQTDDGVDPQQVLAALARIEQTTRTHGVVTGWHALFVGYAAGESLVRLGRFAEAEAAQLAAMRVAAEIRWSFGGLPLFLARTLLLTGRSHELRDFAARVRVAAVGVFAGVSALVADIVAALAGLVEGDDAERQVGAILDASERLVAAGAASYLRVNAALAGAAAAVLVGAEAQAERALRHAARTLDAAPSVWGAAVLDWARGIVALRRGLPHDARTSLERALASFTAAGDRVAAALVRAALARARAAAGDHAEAEARAAASELAGLGVVAPTLPATPTRASRAPVAEVGAGRVRSLAPLRRLTVRGVGPAALRREIVHVLADMFEGADIELAELDGEGAVKATITGGASAGRGTSASLEFGDGTGARLRASVRGELGADGQDVLATVVEVAALALALAAPRGPVDHAAPPLADTVDGPELPGFISASPVMRRLKADLARLSRSRSTVIVTGESGSGKEVVARAIHALSVRADRPYVAFNCAAVPRDLFEGQLFGYRKGAFTGATSDQPGVIRAADGGTLFLDEIAELPLDVQAKLLRFLENGEVFPLGERRPLRVDVRVIAATFRDLEQLVRAGRFREDLFYRLQVVPLHVPPLRERPEDLAALARHFVRVYTPPGHEPLTLAPDALAALARHAWPGNVRELRNVIERSLAFEPLPAVLSAAHIRLR